MNYTVAILISFFLCVHHMGGTARLLLYMVRNKGVCISYSKNNECLIVRGTVLGRRPCVFAYLNLFATYECNNLRNN